MEKIKKAYLGILGAVIVSAIILAQSSSDGNLNALLEYVLTFIVIIGISILILVLAFTILIKDYRENKERKESERKTIDEERRKKEEWDNRRQDIIKKWTEIAEKNPGLTQEELKEIYVGHFPEDRDIGRYLRERGGITSQHTGKIIRYEKRFSGSYCLVCILLCIGIIPGVLYYLLARDTIPIYEGGKE